MSLEEVRKEERKAKLEKAAEALTIIEPEITDEVPPKKAPKIGVPPTYEKHGPISDEMHGTTKEEQKQREWSRNRDIDGMMILYRGGLLDRGDTKQEVIERAEQWEGSAQKLADFKELNERINELNKIYGEEIHIGRWEDEAQVAIDDFAYRHKLQPQHVVALLDTYRDAERRRGGQVVDVEPYEGLSTRGLIRRLENRERLVEEYRRQPGISKDDIQTTEQEIQALQEKLEDERMQRIMDHLDSQIQEDVQPEETIEAQIPEAMKGLTPEQIRTLTPSELDALLQGKVEIPAGTESELTTEAQRFTEGERREIERALVGLYHRNQRMFDRALDQYAIEQGMTFDEKEQMRADVIAGIRRGESG